MKLSHIASAALACTIATFSGCGGTGTPLPPPQKVAVVTFTARTTAAIAATAGKRINDYFIDGINIPAGLSAPVVGTKDKEKLILDNYLTSSFPKTTAYPFGSYSAGSPGRSYLTLYPFDALTTTTNLGFGKLMDLNLLMSNQSLNKNDITTLLLAANPSLIALAKVCPQNAACDLTPPIPVFYNISVSIQSR